MERPPSLRPTVTRSGLNCAPTTMASGTNCVLMGRIVSTHTSEHELGTANRDLDEISRLAEECMNWHILEIIVELWHSVTRVL
jgi:hypothetical protein